VYHDWQIAPILVFKLSFQSKLKTIGALMDPSQTYTIVTVAVLAVIILLVLYISISRKEKMLTPLTDVALAFVLSGFLFSNNLSIGYTLLGIGAVIAVIDVFLRLWKKKPKNAGG
jgi:hypothetical protein